MYKLEIKLEDQLVLDRAEIDRKYIFEILDVIGADGSKKVLDVGCGCGGSTEILHEYDVNYDVIGIDNNDMRIRIANQRNATGIQYRVCDATEMYFEDDSFDIVFARMVFEVCDKVDEILKEMIRVTKRKGKMVIMGNLITTPIVYPEPRYYAKYRICEERLQQLLKDTVYNPLSIVGKLKQQGINKIYFKPYYKDTINCDRRDIFNYYRNKESLDDNLLVRTGLMKISELKTFYSDLDNIIMQDNSIVLYSQYYIIADLP